LGNSYLKSGKDLQKANDYYLESLEIAKELNVFYIQQQIYVGLYELNEKQQNYTAAFKYLKKASDIRDSLDMAETETQLNNLHVQYETEKKEMQITSLEKEKRLFSSIFIISAALALSLIVGLFFVYRYMRNKKRFAEQKVKQLEQEKQLVATQSVLDGETQERSRLARDLHDGLGSMLSSVKLNLNEMKKGVTLEHSEVERFDKALVMLDNSIKELRRVAHHMMPDSLSRFGLKTALSDFCDSISIAEFNYFGGEERLEQKLEVMIYRITHELINNALKHSEATHILVQIVQESDRIALTVQDNGKGFDVSAETKGSGLENIRTRVASFGGNLDINTAKGKGTEVNVEFGLM
jgi:signal transduction histidine kinase